MLRASARVHYSIWLRSWTETSWPVGITAIRTDSALAGILQLNVLQGECQALRLARVRQMNDSRARIKKPAAAACSPLAHASGSSTVPGLTDESHAGTLAGSSTLRSTKQQQKTSGVDGVHAGCWHSRGTMPGRGRGVPFAAAAASRGRGRGRGMSSACAAARSNGVLALSDRGLRQVPSEVLHLFDADAREETEKWWEAVDLVKVDMSHNQLCDMPNELWERLGGQLKVLHLQYNSIGELGEAVGQLRLLQQMNISHNVLRCLPDTLQQLGSLTELRE